MPTSGVWLLSSRSHTRQNWERKMSCRTFRPSTRMRSRTSTRCGEVKSPVR